MKKQLQREYINDAIKEGKGNSKEIWKRLKEVWPLKNKSYKILELNGKIDPNDMANEMNSYFVHIGEQLADDITTEQTNELYTAFPASPPTFNLAETTVAHVQGLINNLNCSKSFSKDGIMARLIKDAGPVIIPVLTHIYNLSIRQKRFPDAWKTALVSPIHKDGDKTEPSNYRPIALLPILSKVLEHIVHEQVSAHLRHIEFFNDA